MSKYTQEKMSNSLINYVCLLQHHGKLASIGQPLPIEM